MAKNGTDPDVARVARMVGEPARAAMLNALLGGQALTAGELARRALISPATASGHLARLLECGMIVRRQSGRHRYFELASRDVATLMETLARVALPQNASMDHGLSDHAIRFARTCYDHLAGQLGVLLADTLRERGLILADDSYQLTESGAQWLRTLDIDVDALRAAKRSFIRPCLDWSERRNHLAGAVGAAITATLLDREWLARLPGTRAVRLTLRGREGLYRTLRIEIPAV